MPDLVEQMYCSQQINIPPNLPYILKQYAKAAIRTQPQDLLFWSAAYFKAKANNLPPPVKERIEYPPVDTPSGLSPGFLKVLHKQLGGCETVKKKVLSEKWMGVCLKKEALTNMLKLGRFTDNITWIEFLAIAAGYLCPMLSRTMILICEILTEEPEGGSAMIPVETFNSLYTYLARLNCGNMTIIEEIPSESSAKESNVLADKTIIYTRSITDITGDMTKRSLDTDRDSNAGLMVWPDIEPSDESTSHEPSPRPRDEGATSEDGLIVLEDITKFPDSLHTIIKTPFSDELGTLVPDTYEDKDTTPCKLETPKSIDPTSDFDGIQIIQTTQAAGRPSVSGSTETIDDIKSSFTKVTELVNVDEIGEETNYENENKDNVPNELQLVDNNMTTNVHNTNKPAEETGGGAEESEKMGELDKGENDIDNDIDIAVGRSTTIGNHADNSNNMNAEDSKIIKESEKQSGDSSLEIVEKESINVIEKDEEQGASLIQVENEERGSKNIEESEDEPILGASEGEPGAEKLGDKASLEVIADIAGSKESIYAVKEVEDFVPPLETSYGVGIQGSKVISDITEIGISEIKEDGNKTYIVSAGSIENDIINISKEDYDVEKNDFEKEISSLPSTKYLGIVTTSDTLLRPDIIGGKTFDETKSVTSESKSFIILDEDQYWEYVPGIGPVIPEGQINIVVEYMNHWASKQEGMVMPRNLRHFLCPNLDHPDTFKDDLVT